MVTLSRHCCRVPSSATETGNWNWTHKNVIDRQHSARFQKSPKSAISLHPTEQENPKSRRKTYTVKPAEHGGRGERDRYSWGVVVRDSAPWETVKPINVAVKKKTELFSSTLILPTRYVQYDTSTGQHFCISAKHKLQSYVLTLAHMVIFTNIYYTVHF